MHITKMLICLGGMMVIGATLTQAAEDKVSTPDQANPRVEIRTNKGKMLVELSPKESPITVKNFLGYVSDGFYTGTIFHRVIKTFMIQGGGFTPDMKEKTTKPPIKNEADNGLSNVRGTIAMARTPKIDSATAQFFINVVDNKGLDYKGPDPSQYGYAVFGKVIEGMDVVDKIKDVPTAAKGAYDDVPTEPIIIQSISLAK